MQWEASISRGAAGFFAPSSAPVGQASMQRVQLPQRSGAGSVASCAWNLVRIRRSVDVNGQRGDDDAEQKP